MRSRHASALLAFLAVAALLAALPATVATAADGEQLFLYYCANCHGPGANSGGMAPDLRASPVLLDLGALASVVRDGTRLARAMPQFPDITDHELTALTHYVRKMAAEAAPRPASPAR